METTGTGAARRPRGAALVALALAGATALTGLPGASAAGRAPVQTVVVTGAGDLVQAVRAAGGQVLDRLPLVGGVSARLPQGAHLAPGLTVVPNRALSVAGESDSSGPASTVRQTLGLAQPAGEGAGVTVAVVDTGVADVPDLAGRLTHVDVTGTGTGDGYGHGTFVAGLVAGDGAASQGAYAGVAPGARVLDVRVADDEGDSDLVTVLKGLQVVAAHPEVRVVNLSLSSGSPLPFQVDPLTQALEALWAKGVTVVVPAGNDGADGKGSITSPGIDPVLLTVGGLDEHASAGRADDTVPSWSSQGPAKQHVAKPDLVAPGSHVVSTAAVGSAVWDAYPGSRVGSSYLKGSGTSFSTAVASGAAAVLLAGRPDLTPGQVKALVTGTAYAVPGGAALAGSGGLDLAAALATPAPAADAVDGTVPGDPQQWGRVVQAMLGDDPAAAANAWAGLSAEARQWAANAWARLTPEARQWAARQWAARQWAGEEYSSEEWVARQWAARQWAARQWAARQWAGDDWTARQWAARQWTANAWSARQWAARQWTEQDWSARHWADEGWTARQWSGDDWSARQWSARQWSARQWSARQWSANDWS